MNRLLPLGLRFEGHQLQLDGSNAIAARRRDDPLALERPSLIDDVSGVFTQQVLQLRAIWVGVGRDVTIEVCQGAYSLSRRSCLRLIGPGTWQSQACREVGRK